MRPYFVRFGQRWQHFWIAGSGAPLLLLQGSPHSARSLKPLIEALSQSFLVIAPDLPGNGYSDPLTSGSDRVSQYASAMVTLMDELRIDGFGVFGAHSGAVIAAEIAILAGSRVRGLVCDGYPLWTEAEAESLTDTYLEDAPPVDSGAHLATLWSRLIDQQLYFPWFHRHARNAIRRDLNDSDRLNELALDYLSAGAHYAGSVRGSLKADGEARLRTVNEQQVRALLLADPTDVIADHLTRVPALANTTCVHTENTADRARKVSAFFTAAKIPTLDKGVYLPATTRHYVQPRHHSLDVDEWLYVDIPANARTLWLHDVGQSHRRAPASNARIDLPGHGYSTLQWPDSKAEVVSIIDEALAALGLEGAVMSGRGLGRQLAEAYAGTTPTPMPPVAMPDLTVDWAGGHLHRAWHYCRYRTQFSQWSDRVPGGRTPLTMPDAAILHEQTIDLLRAGADTLNKISAQA